MTWGEFKKEVERNGVTDDMEVAYLDLYPEHGVTVTIYAEREGPWGMGKPTGKKGFYVE